MASAMAGCASWIDRSNGNSTPHSSHRQLTSSSEGSRSIVIDVAFHPIEPEFVDEDRIASLWQWVDEMVIEPAQRERLAANGLRVGKVIRQDQFESRLSDMSGPQDVVDMFLSEADVASEVSHGVNRIPMRLGKRYELPLRQPRSGSHVTLVSRNQTTIGKTLQDPQYLLAITPTKSVMEGQVLVRCRPEVQHGNTQHKWVSSESALRIDSSRETWSLDYLDINFEAAEGDVFLISGSYPSFGLGKEMMTGKSVDNVEQQVVVLLKISKLPSTPESF
ncbi:hypothetical protein Q31b_16530 [Novipirellula aureliae]|uniref:Uncharacterized protein n=2 Tax=Novipirellula aureliae TaxID=2527966 RepID=A0A5C6E5J2_9BACT|nr:hypothetical protein Q31b_16530 [Novipirellula aureliae]